MSRLPSRTGSPWRSCLHCDYVADADTEAAMPVVARTPAANATTSTSPAIPSGPISCHKASRRRIGVVGLALALVISGLASLAASAAPASAATNQVVATVEVGKGPAGIAFNPANGNFYVTNFFDQDGDGRGTVQMINGSTNQVVTTVKVGMLPVGVAFNSVNRHLYVANSGDHTVSVINGSTNRLVATIPVGAEPYGVASANGYVYVTNRKDATLSVINGSTNQVVSTVGVGRAYEPGITFGSLPTAVAFNPTDGYLYVALTGDNGVGVIDSATNGWVTGVGVGRRPSAVAYNRSNGNIYVANGQDATVSVISGSTLQVIDTVPLGVTAGDEGSLVHYHGIAYNSANGNVYVANRAAHSLSVINGSDNQVIDTVAVGKAPNAVAFDSVDGDAYVANFGLVGEHDHDTVSVILNTSQAVTFTSTAPPHPTVGGTYTATAVGGPSGNPVVFSVDSASTPGACTVSSAGAVAFTGAGSCVIDANQAGNTRYSAARQGQQSLTIVGFQTVKFTSQPPLSSKVGGAYTATASGGASGNPVVFSSDSTSTPDACSVSAAGAVAFTGEGSCVINANQAGNTIYFAAPQAQQTLSIAAGLPIQRITFSSTPPPDPKVLGAYTATATGGASGNPVVFSSDSTSTPGACTVAGTGAVAFTGVGSCVINANQAGNDTYAVAPQVQQTLAITKSSQTITFTSTPPPGAAVGGTYQVTATGGASGNTVFVYPSPPPSSNGVCELRGVREIYFIGVGTCGIAAVQGGNAAYDAAPVARQSFTVAGQSRTQTIAFTSAAPPSPTVGGTYTATASGGPSGNPVVFSVDASSSPGACSVSSAGAVAFTGPGTCVITADQAGNSSYDAAAPATQTLTVGRGSQTVAITSTPPGDSVVGVTYPVTAVGGASSQPVVVGTSTPATCTANASGLVTFTAVGVCTVTADQAGDANFVPASQVAQDVPVTTNAQSITFTPPSGGEVGGSATLTATGGPSGAPVTFSVDPGTATGVCAVGGPDGTTLSYSGAGSCVVNVNQAAQGPYAAAAQVQRTIEVRPAQQTISFHPPAGGIYGGGATLSAEGGASGNPVTFSVDTTSSAEVCAVSGINGAQLTYTGVGSCVVYADQAASASYLAAARAKGTITVTAAPLTLTASSPTAVYGAAVPEVTASYSGFVNNDTPSSLTTAPTCSTAATTGPGAGLHPTACTGAAAANYTIAYMPGTLTVTPASLTITASDATMTYGAAAPAVTADFTGLVNGDQPTVLGALLSCGTTAGPTSSVAGGPYVTSCTGAVNANYTIAYVPGKITVTPATLTVSANPVNRVYGAANPPLTATLSGFVNGETPSSATTGSAACTTPATASSGIGTYAISCTAATLSSPNYILAFAETTLAVTPAPLTVTANPVSRLFGAANPPLTATLSGFVNGDNATSATSGSPVCTTPATAASSVGAYQVTCGTGTLTAANYQFTFAPGLLTVTASMTVTGTQSGAVTIRAGEALYVPAGTTLQGPITIDAGGALDIEGGSVTGRISTTSPGGPSAVRLCGAHVHAVTISGATGPVVIGAVSGCAGNTVMGPVSITANAGGVSVVGAAVTGPLTVTGNRGGIVYLENTASGPVSVSDNS
jgi:YVTN family beta-propeller protein